MSSGSLTIGGTSGAENSAKSRLPIGKSSKKAGMRRINMQNRRR